MELDWHPPQCDRVDITFAWGNAAVDYAPDVYFGEAALGGRGIARPWAEVGLSQFDLATLTTAHVKPNLRVDNAFVDAATDLGDAFKGIIDNYDWGIDGRNEKRYRTGVPVWKFITDSGALRDSQQMGVDRS
jgi:hypothetical protein